jgi:hypothetical protein
MRAWSCTRRRSESMKGPNGHHRFAELAQLDGIRRSRGVPLRSGLPRMRRASRAASQAIRTSPRASKQLVDAACVYVARLEGGGGGPSRPPQVAWQGDRRGIRCGPQSCALPGKPVGRRRGTYCG